MPKIKRLVALALLIPMTSSLAAFTILPTEKANAGCEPSYSIPPGYLGSAAIILTCAGKLAWLTWNTYRVRALDLSNAFSQAYGYCPSDPNVLGNEYANRNKSRYTFKLGSWMYFVKN